MDVPTTLTDSGFKDVFVGAELFKALRIPSYAFSDPQNTGKLKEIAEHLNASADPFFEIQKLTRSAKNPNLPPIDHFVNYARLKKQEQGIAEQLKGLQKELSIYE